MANGGYIHGLRKPHNFPYCDLLQVYETCSHNLMHKEKASLFNFALGGGYCNEGQRRQRKTSAVNKLLCLEEYIQNLKTNPDLRIEVVQNYTEREFKGLASNFLQTKNNKVEKANTLQDILDSLKRSHSFIIVNNWCLYIELTAEMLFKEIQLKCYNVNGAQHQFHYSKLYIEEHLLLKFVEDNSSRYDYNLINKILTAPHEGFFRIPSSTKIGQISENLNTYLLGKFKRNFFIINTLFNKNINSIS